MTDKEFYAKRKKAGVCVRCGREDAYTMNGRSYCAECAERAARNQLRRKEDPAVRSEINERYKLMRERRKLSGLCPRCGKPNSEDFVLCARCRAKSRKAKERSRRDKGIRSMEERMLGDSCYVCGGPVIPGLKVCKEHYAHMIDMNRKASAEISEGRKRAIDDLWKFIKVRNK